MKLNHGRPKRRIIFDNPALGMILRKAIISALAVAALVFCGQGAMAAEKGTIRVAGLNLRSGPGKQFKVVAQLAKGVSVKILAREKGWLKIDFEGRKGFILNRSRYITIEAEDKGGVTTAAENQADTPSDEKASIEKQLKQSKSEVAAISRKEKAVIEQFNAGEKTLNDVRNQVRVAKAGIKGIDKKIDKIAQSSRDLKQEIRHSEAYAANRLTAMYKLNQVGRIQLLATSDSFYDFIQRKSGLERILRQDEALLIKLHKDQAALESLLGELKARKEEKRKLQATLNTRINKLSAQQKKRRALLKRIRSEKSLELAALAALKQATEALDDTMLSLPPAKQTVPSAMPDSETKPFKAYKGLLSWPVKGKIVSFFGPYRDEKYKVMNFQSGVNIKAERGEPIRAISAGLTIYASWFKGFGNMIIVDHGEHYYTVYAHLEEVFKAKGDRVEKGEVIATVGDSGSMMGPALHFEVRHHGKPVDPLKWIRKG